MLKHCSTETKINQTKRKPEEEEKRKLAKSEDVAQNEVEEINPDL